MDLGSVSFELYGLPPGEFVSVRDERALEAKRSGDPELAAELKQLRRPTVGAWLANLLVRECPDQLTVRLDLGVAMRKAQEDLDGSGMRRLSKQRRQMVPALVEEARSIAYD